MTDLPTEKFFSFVTAGSLSGTTCNLCNTPIPAKAEYKTNLAPKRRRGLSVCAACYESPQFQEYVDARMTEIRQAVEELETKLTEAEIAAYSCDCDDERPLRIKTKLVRLSRAASFPITLLANPSYSSEGRYTTYGIRFAVTSPADFKEKWAFVVANAQTKCGCSLFYGDAGIPTAYLIHNDHMEDFPFELLSSLPA